MSNAGDGGRGAGCGRLAGGGAAAGGGAGRWLGGVGRLPASGWIPRLTDPGERVDAPACWLVVVVCWWWWIPDLCGRTAAAFPRCGAGATGPGACILGASLGASQATKKAGDRPRTSDRPASKQPTRKASLSMGYSQKYSSTHLDRNNDPRAQAERAAFQHVNASLRDMPYCEPGRPRASGRVLLLAIRPRQWGGASVPRGIRPAQGGSRIGEWWDQKHTASAGRRRPHTQYTPAQAARGRQVALMRKKGRTDWTALRAQLARQKGGKLAEIAEQLGCSLRTVSRLTKRQFPRIVGVVLSHFFGWTHGKSSCGSAPEIQGVDPKESLPRVHIDQQPASKSPDERCIDPLDAQGAMIPDLLRALLGHGTALSGKNSPHQLKARKKVLSCIFE